jgi:phosphoribosylformylglycinamidine cyclo-ligase
MADVDIVGGEIAVLPEIVKGVDLSGTALGFLSRNDMVTGADVQIGDAIIGIPSTGIHSNGMTLARKILEGNKISLDDKPARIGRSLGEELLTPTEIYVRRVLKAIRRAKPTGMVDITGGGLKNFVRLKKNVYFSIDKPLPPQPLFGFLAEVGEVEPTEMYKTFNMGMGYAIVCREKDAGTIVKELGGGARVVGSVTDGNGVGIPQLGVSFSTY